MENSDFPTQGVTVPSFAWVSTAIDAILSPNSIAVITVIATLLILWRAVRFVNDVIPGDNS